MRSPISSPQSNGESHRHGGEAVVLGASMAGLLATTVLADHFDRVTLVERDELPDDGQPRRGVPQARHAHVLLPRGADALEELFPGFLRRLEEDGSTSAASLSRYHFEFNGHLLSREDAPTETPLYGQSRPFLDAHVLERVRARANVQVLPGHEVLALRTTDHDGRVVGVTVTPHERPHSVMGLDADLVVVATGRSGRVPFWLEQMGYDAPPEEEVHVDIMYASCVMRLDDDLVGDLDAVFVGPVPDRPKGVSAFRMEDGAWIVTMAGFAHNHPPKDPEGWTAFAQSVSPPAFAQAVAQGEMTTKIVGHRFTDNLRRRYDKLDRFPEGLVVAGDAVSSVNPIYGQGMTVAALEALALRDALRHGPEHLAPRFFKAAAKPVGNAWAFAVGGDLAMPRDVVPGPRPFPVRAVNAYLDLYQAAAENDPVLAWHFLKVTGFDEPPRTLFSPDSLRRMAAGRRRRAKEGRQEPAALGTGW
jgi:2-polyprenyl-6-methoxyphenol hydroxylase-like FAD-dependent oxidoreductase